jgi:cytochrome c nitrite reductase small subunit
VAPDADMKVVNLARMVVSFQGLPRKWQTTIYILAGLAAGLGLFIARISNAASYLSDAPQTCINCHVMTDAYASWQQGSHGRVAICNDCHVPHINPAAKYAFKASDGLKHSYVYTFRLEPQVLDLSKGAKPVIQDNCVRCHSQVLAMVRLSDSSQRKCWDCHGNIHGSIHSISSSPAELRPDLPQAGLDVKTKGVE